jgi:hypothetical protein
MTRPVLTEAQRMACEKRFQRMIDEISDPDNLARLVIDIYRGNDEELKQFIYEEVERELQNDELDDEW